MSLFSKTKDSILREFDSEKLKIEAWGDNALRVRATPDGEFIKKETALLGKPEAQNVEIHISKNEATIENGKIKARIDKNGKVSFFNQKDELLLSENLKLAPLKKPAREFKPNLGGAYHLTMRFEANKDEKIFGMGQYQQEYMNLKGCKLELAHRNSQASVPLYISNRGYGFLWNNPAIGEVSFSKNITEWESVSTKELDYVIIAEDTPAEIEERYQDITGHVPMMPEYAMGLWQSKLRYVTQKEVLKVAREYKKRGVPLSVIVIDFFHWPHQGDFKFDSRCFPDPEGMIKELNEMGTELMVSVWPTIQSDSENYKKMLEKGYLIRNDRGPRNHTEFVADGVFYDTTNPGARDFVWGKIKKNYYDKGVRIFWLDEAEPEFMLYDYDNHRYHIGNCLEVGNIYPLMYAKNFYDGMRKEGQDNIINLIRCAWAGSQRYGALCWSGDIHSTFEEFRYQIRAGLNMAIAGIPWWTTDIGGFTGANIHDDNFKELIVRWFEYATFTPVLRMHGDRQPYSHPKIEGIDLCYSGAPNEIWSYGDEAYEIFKKYVTIREKMKPYIKEAMKKAHEKGTPPMRPLFYDYPDDKYAWNIEDEFIFGNALLIAPVTESKCEKRQVYLPAGERWVNVHTGKVYDGGINIIVETPIDKIPIFAKEKGKFDIKIFG